MIPEMNPETLDCLQQESLSQLQEALRLVERFGFSLEQSSPTVVLLDAAIDLALLLKRSFTFEESKQERLNDLVKINEYKTDSLGNAKSIRIKQFRDAYADPLSDQFFTELAEFFVRIKNRQPIHQSFMDWIKSFLPDLSPVSQPEQNKAHKKRTKRHKNAAYYRRQRKC